MTSLPAAVSFAPAPPRVNLPRTAGPGLLPRLARGLFLAVALASAHPALGVAAHFTFTGAGSGTLAGVPFGSANFSIALQADTSNRYSPWAGAYKLPVTAASIDITGIGTLQFNTPLQIWSVPSYGVGLDNGGGLDLYDILELYGWDMLTSTSFTGNSGMLLQWNQSPVQTSGGVLYFADRSGIPATFTAVVPEPGGAGLAMAGGAALLAGWVARRPYPRK